MRRNLYKYHYSASLFIVVVLVPMVFVLAYLQYKWIGQVSDNERERRKTILQTDARRFGEDFDREIARAYLTLQADESDFNQEGSNGFAERYKRWTTKAPYPKIIGSIWLVTMETEMKPFIIHPAINTQITHYSGGPVAVAKPIYGSEVVVTSMKGVVHMSDTPNGVKHSEGMIAGGGGDTNTNINTNINTASALFAFKETGLPRISCFDSTREQFVQESAWPAVLETMRQQLEIKQKSGLPITIIQQEILKPVDEEALSIIIPINQLSIFSNAVSENAKNQHSPDSHFRFVVAVLNLDYIKQEFIPALAKRYFSNGSANGSMDYNLSIVSRRKPQMPIFFTDLQMAKDAIGSNDATTNLLGLRFQTGVIGMSTPDIDSPALVYTGPPGIGVETTVFDKENQTRNEVSFTNLDDSHWQLFLKHRTGSLDIAINQVRNRNMAISFGILLILTGSMIIILIATQRARRLARQQMEFVAGISHELRTPVTVVCMTGANLAQGRIREHRKVMQYGELIQAEGKRLADMIEQVLSFASTDSDQSIASHKRIVKVQELIENALAVMRSQIEEKGFICETKIVSSVFINVDASSVERAVQNLISNAIKYSGDSRYIAIIANLTQSKRNVKEVQITVEDFGLGIEPDELMEIFKPFRRGREIVESNIPGTGLGLSLVQRIMRDHGGRVSVRSTPEHGSAFTLHFPVSEMKNHVRKELKLNKYEEANLVDRR